MDHRLDSLRIDPELLAGLVRTSYEADLGEVRAFLPGRVPLDELPSAFARYLSACAELPARYPAVRGGVRRWLEHEFARYEPAVRRAIPGLTHAERETLTTVLSVLGHTYRWDCVPPAHARFLERHISLPPGIGEPWTALARGCGQPRVGTTWSLHLCNWRMKDRPGGAVYLPEELTGDNVRVAQNWLPPVADVHLERFSISFVLFEARGAAVLGHVVDTVQAAASWHLGDAMVSLEKLHAAIRAMTVGFSMNVRGKTVDPLIWRELVQPTFPWSAEADEPGRVEGGPSGIQLGTIQALDAALGVTGDSAMAELAKTARRYMPTSHRRFLQNLDHAGPMIRAFVHQSSCEELVTQFNKCVGALGAFRAAHHARGSQYLAPRSSGEASRASTGLTIGIDDDPIATFGCTMAARAAETEAAILQSVRRLQAADPGIRGHAGTVPGLPEAGSRSKGRRSWPR
jgi:indoleamine 2,3-dioxygenase